MDIFSVDFYTHLGLNYEQIRVLSELTYGDYDRLVKAYRKSDDYKTGVPFCTSLVRFAGNRELTQKVVDEYILNIGLDSEFNFGSFNIPPLERHTMGKGSIFQFVSPFSASEYESKYSVSLDGLSETDCFCDIDEDCFYNEADYRYTMGRYLDSISTEKFEPIIEKGFKDVLTNPTSTFRTTCNSVSMDMVIHKYLMYRKIDKDMIRLEELLNYCDFDIKNNTDNKFEITTEICDKPGSKNKILFIGVKAQEYIPEKQNVVILLDISGSMGSNTLVTQASIIALVSKLNDGDKLSLITYSSSDEILLDSITVNHETMDKVIETLFSIDISGCTFGSKGLDAAYAKIDENMIEDGVNRVVLITDGDFNFGKYSVNDIKKLALDKKKTGAQLSIIGCGEINTNDELMNTLAKNGDGNYCYVHNLLNIDKSIVRGYNKLMYSVAKDVKAQVEFNPKYVEGYRLMGYENREIGHKDFKNDEVIAEPFGSGSQAIAVYELQMADGVKLDDEFKYQTRLLYDSNDLCNVNIRYKELDAEESKEITKNVKYYNETELNGKMQLNSMIAYCICVYGEALRKSEYIDISDIKTAIDMLDDIETEMAKEGTDRNMVNFMNLVKEGLKLEFDMLTQI